jgi:glycine cleavage system H protein
MEYPEHLRYSAEHEWVAVDGDRARVGITDYAQDALGDVVYVQLPEVGATVAAMAACSEVESTKSVSDVYAPVGGTIAEVNERLADVPELLNQEPYGGGWMFAIDMSDPSELDRLMDAAAYRQLVDEQ